MTDLLTFTSSGIYCAQGDFFIDPWKPVDKALITHAHSDHARFGSNNYLSHHHTLPLIKYRLSNRGNFESLEYGEIVKINNVNVSFHPAGHIIGSSQIRVWNENQCWLVSGDYKLENDGLSTPFEPVKCDFFITESTFGLPVFNWKKQKDIFDDINAWWASNQEKGIATLLMGYTLGKAQRLLQNIDPTIGPVYSHGAIFNMNELIKDMGFNFISAPNLTSGISKADLRKALILAPPSALNSGWTKRFSPFSSGVASGWMALRGAKRRSAVDRGFVLSDHVDWNGLNKTIKETGAKKIYVTHGYSSIFSAWLNESGISAEVVKTQFNDDGEDTESENADGGNEA